MWRQSTECGLGAEVQRWSGRLEGMGALGTGGWGCSAASGAASGAHASGVTRSGEPRVPILAERNRREAHKSKREKLELTTFLFLKNRLPTK